MNKFILSGLFAAATVTGAAFANEAEEGCNAYAEAHGVDNSGCACLGEAAAEDADLAAALAAITTPEELEAADDATKEAIAACFPE